MSISKQKKVLTPEPPIEIPDCNAEVSYNVKRPNGSVMYGINRCKGVANGCCLYRQIQGDHDGYIGNARITNGQRCALDQILSHKERR